MSNCDFAKNLSSYLDQELSDKEKQALEQHLAHCQICSDELVGLKKLSEKLKKWQMPELPQGFEGVVRDKILKQEIERGRVAMDKKTLKLLVPSGVLAGILLLMFVNVSVHRGIQGRMRASADFIGEKYVPRENQQLSNFGTSFGSGAYRTAKRDASAMRFAKAQAVDQATAQYEPYYQASHMEQRLSAKNTDGLRYGGGNRPRALEQIARVGDSTVSRGYMAVATAQSKSVETATNVGEGSVIVIQPVMPATGVGDMIIRTAEMSLEVADAKQTYTKVNHICKEMGGYVASSNFLEDDMSRVTLRIPKDKFATALDKLGELGKVENITSSSEDVHQQYINIKTELDAAMVVYNKMVEALNKKQATIDNAIRLESELSPVLRRIAGFKNQLEYLNNAVSFTTISVVFHEAKISANALKKSFRVVRESLLAGFISVGMIVSRIVPYVVIAVFYFIIYAIIFVPLVWFIWRVVKKHIKK